MAADNPYSRFVAWVRIVLPVMALALLASLFMFQGPDDSVSSLPFSEMELAELAKGQGIGGPHYTGMTEDGRALSLEAETAFPRLGDRRVVEAKTVRATLETDIHGAIRLVAQSAVIDQEASAADLTGGVLIETDSGYRVITQAMRAALDRTDVESLAPAKVSGPGFEAEAGKLILKADTQNPDDVILVFKEGVDLIYTAPSR